MSILIIGNGFDIAHGLPTKYEDFLKFTDQFIMWKNLQESEMNIYLNKEDDTTFIPYLTELYNRSNVDTRCAITINELTECIIDNLWLEYFKKIHIKENWIDFEQEISRIIRLLDDIRIRAVYSFESSGDDEVLSNHELRELKVIIPDFKGSVSIKDITSYKDILMNDLNKLIRCLEIYLSDYINNQQILPAFPFLDKLKINKVLSFNYTNTYARVYDSECVQKTEYDFIHGQASLQNTIDSCNMVVGIDEYLTGDAQNTDNEFIQFKKFFQRIYKETGDKYLDWIDKIISVPIYKDSPPKVEVYIIGHSLDNTDGDILRNIILTPNVRTTIFYHDRNAFEKQIANLVKVITEEELIHRTGGANKSIRFRNINNVTVSNNKVD